MQYAPSEVAASARPMLRVLAELSIPCYIGGSLASAAYGASRSTIDADLVADIKPEQVKTFYDLVEPIYFVGMESIKQAVDRRESFNAIHREHLIKTDVFVMKHYLYERQVFDHVRLMPLDPSNPDELLPFCSVEDIILNKLIWYDQGGRVSERQWTDLLAVMRVQASVLDRTYMEQWASYLDIAGLLSEASKVAGLEN